MDRRYVIVSIKDIKKYLSKNKFKMERKYRRLLNKICH